MTEPSTRVAIVILAAGRGRRFGDATTGSKVVARLENVPLVRSVAKAALGSRAASVTVVCGHDHESVVAALAGLDTQLVYNAAFTSGMGSSLSAGVAALSNDVDALLVMLADMPLVQTRTLDILIAHFEARRNGVDAIVPTYHDTRGNPVLIARSLFPALRRLQDDKGARELLAAPDLRLDLCEVDDRGIVFDIDTLEALRTVSGMQGA